MAVHFSIVTETAWAELLTYQSSSIVIMGKKGKRHNKKREPIAATEEAGVSYPSDGPSQEELASLPTSSSSLQVKLDQLTQLALANNRVDFVQQFVPLDLSKEDTDAYLQELTTAPEAEGSWRNLSSEIAALAGGIGVNKIEGDQVSTATFYFAHPILQGCQREVTFVCTNGEWRAEG